MLVAHTVCVVIPTHKIVLFVLARGEHSGIAVMFMICLLFVNICVFAMHAPCVCVFLSLQVLLDPQGICRGHTE